jgi:hypothetical protein
VESLVTRPEGNVVKIARRFNAGMTRSELIKSRNGRLNGATDPRIALLATKAFLKDGKVLFK